MTNEQRSALEAVICCELCFLRLRDLQRSTGADTSVHALAILIDLALVPARKVPRPGPAA
jgi:hypothetical protein